MLGGKRLGLFVGLAIVVAGAVVMLAWPRVPYPATPVPTLKIAPGVPFSARLIAPQSGLTALPARITGRTAPAATKGGLIHEWPGLHAEARFHGTAVTLRLNDTVDHWRVSLDGAPVEIARPGQKDLRIEGLASADHLIRAERISESRGPAEFDGFLVDTPMAVLPPPAPLPRLIEFIGDSDTVGFGNTAKRRDCSTEQIFAATDTSRSFPAQVAAVFDADYRIVARSGLGLLRNYGGDAPDRTMRALYPLALPSDPAAPRLPEQPADLLVIGLGSNDFGSDMASGEPWPDHARLSQDFGPALSEFARQRLDEHPGAALILLAFGEYGEDLIRPYREAAEDLAAGGKVTVGLVVLPELQRSACLWHPSLQDHAMIAKELDRAIRETLPGWDG